MACSWFPEGTGGLTLHVDDPGCGVIFVTGIDPATGEGWSTTFHAGDIGQLLDQVTDQALGDRPDGVRMMLVTELDQRQARAALRAVQQAVLLAAAGTDKAERLAAHPDDEPLAPLCAACSTGSDYTEVPTRSTWCERYGHRVFGAEAETTWEQAQSSYASHRQLWQDRQARAARRSASEGRVH